MRDVCAVRLLHEEQIRSLSSNFGQAGLLEPWIWTFEGLLNCLTRRRASPLTKQSRMVWKGPNYRALLLAS